MNQIGRYEKIEEIGRGGMSTVYRARDTRLQREVALKLLPAYLSREETFTQRFQREAQVIARLEHPHIVPIYDVGGYEGQPFLVMRLLTGGTLRQRLANSKVMPLDLVGSLRQVAAALDAAHRQGIIHRDIKPSNILFDDQGTAFVTDFGVAKVANAATQLTGSGLLGTPAYMSAEQFTGKGLDGRSDQYSLAIVVYEALTGELPFDGDTVQQLIYQHLQASPRDINVVNPALPAAIAPVMAQALAKQPAQRFQTTTAFIDSLASALTAPNPVQTRLAAQPLPPAKQPQARPPTTSAQKMQQAYQQGLQALADQDWTLAEESFARVLEMEPDHPKARSRYQEAQLQRLQQQKPSGILGRLATWLPIGQKRGEAVADQAKSWWRNPLWLLVGLVLLAGVIGLLLLSSGGRQEPADNLAAAYPASDEITPTVTPPAPTETPQTVTVEEMPVVLPIILPADNRESLHFAPDERMLVVADTTLGLQLPDGSQLFLEAGTELEVITWAGREDSGETILALRQGVIVLEAAGPAQVETLFGYTAVTEGGLLGVVLTERPFYFEAACFIPDCTLLRQGEVDLPLQAGQTGLWQGEIGEEIDYDRYADFAIIIPTPTATPTSTKTATPSPTPTSTPRPTLTPMPTSTFPPPPPPPPPPPSPPAPPSSPTPPSPYPPTHQASLDELPRLSKVASVLLWLVLVTGAGVLFVAGPGIRENEYHETRV
jgi:serine/threonine protein kinase